MITRRAYRTPLFEKATLRLLAVSLLAVLCIAALSPEAALAQRSGQKIEAFEGVKLDQNLGDTIPTDLAFRNADGEEVQLARYFDGERPVVLSLVYHECPMLCNLMVEGLTRTLGEMAWTPGEEFDVLTVSFNKREGPQIASENKKAAVANLGKPEAAAGWHFLTGSEESIQRLTQAVGFHFKWIEEQQEFAHPSAVIFLSGEGKITRYLQGINPDASDTRKALVEASDGKVGNVLDQLALRCFQYDPESNSYVASAFNIMRLGSALFAVLVGVGLLVFWRRERDDQQEHASEQEADDDREHGSSWTGALSQNA